jgi:hypothetical protein
VNAVRIRRSTRRELRVALVLALANWVCTLGFAVFGLGFLIGKNWPLTPVIVFGSLEIAVSLSFAAFALTRSRRSRRR